MLAAPTFTCILARDGREQGIAELEQGLELSRETGARMDDPYYLALLADACARAGRIDAAWTAVESASELAPSTRRFFFESELTRLSGELLLGRGRNDEAESRLREALALARRHGSPSLELRAALSLARALRDESARELTASIYSRFTEGFETHDLVTARALLGEVG